jgi:hypothetical protein
MLRWISNYVNLWVMLGAILVAGGLVFLVGLLVYLTPFTPPSAPAAAFTMIPAPTLTATPTPVIHTPTPTVPPAVDGITLGNYVQIAGTGGAGLRIRSGPGTSNAPNFLGMDSEVFVVKDGPQVSDGFTWFFLEAPYDPSRSGWAASQYLSVIVEPTPTP